jgi:membrane-bound serine protease (ClpP class)
MKAWLVTLAAGLMLCPAASLRATQVGLIKIDGPIGPATAQYVSRAIDTAADKNDECLIIQLDTPGGLVTSTEEIVKKFYAAKIPVVVYVSPSGAGATSAGTFITMAADIAAMAPNTRIGAAHPVSMGLGGTVGGDTNDVMLTKVENDVATFVQTIAEKRGRNARWAESAVRQSASITSEKALELKVIDLIAKDMPDLLKQLDGRSVTGKALKTAGADVVEIPMNTAEHLFQQFWQPEVMMILMLIAIYGIIAEMSHPGAIFPGVVGVIALILMLYMSATLPVNVAGLALIILALVLFAVDVFAPTHGVLTAGGVVSFFLGMLMLFNRTGQGFGLPLAWIIPATTVTALFFIFVVSAGWRAQFQPVRAGRETLLGRTVTAVSRIDATGGKVFVEGEYWNAVSETAAEKDQPVEITGIEGLTLKVKPKN